MPISYSLLVYYFYKIIFRSSKEQIWKYRLINFCFDTENGFLIPLSLVHAFCTPHYYLPTFCEVGLLLTLHYFNYSIHLLHYRDNTKIPMRPWLRPDTKEACQSKSFNETTYWNHGCRNGRIKLTIEVRGKVAGDGRACSRGCSKQPTNECQRSSILVNKLALQHRAQEQPIVK